jgi:hypothetical protein
MMLRKILIGSIAVLAGTAMIARAEPKDDLTSAAKKLADADNYTWTSTVRAEGPGGSSTQGKTQKDGLTWLSISRQDNVTETVFKGDKGAVKTDKGWEALPEPGQGRGAGGGGGGGGGAAAGGGGGGQGGGGMRNPGMMMARMVRNFKAPAAQVEELVSKTQDLKQDGDAYTGTLSEETVKSMMTMGGGRGGRGNRGGGGAGGGGGGAQGGGGGPDVKNAHGDVKFWSKDGAITKYEMHVQGIANIQGEDREINRTTTVEIKDVGSTKLDVPDEAKQKAGLSS